MKVALEDVVVDARSREALAAREQLRALMEARVPIEEGRYWPALADLAAQILDGPQRELEHRLAVLIDACATALSAAAKIHKLTLGVDEATAVAFLFNATEAAIQEGAAA